MFHPRVANLPPTDREGRPAPERSAPAISARGLTKRYSGRCVLRDLDFTVDPGRLVLLRGANGVGKTTLLRCLAGNARPDVGEVRWFDQPLGQLEQRTRRLVGVVAHQNLVYGELTPRENLLLAARLYGLESPGAIVERWLQRAALAPVALRPADKLSQGTRQRLAIARGLLHDPLLVLLDEPFTALDAIGRTWLAGEIAGLRARGRAVVVSTHVEWPGPSCVDDEYELGDGRLTPVSRGAIANDGRLARVA